MLYRSFGRRPFSGAWIETFVATRAKPFALVAPSRGRGLKQLYEALGIPVLPVAPSRGRGLKRFTA